MTAAVIPTDALIGKELCIKCGDCAACCPNHCITLRDDQVIGLYDKTACLEKAEELTARRCYPCGVCVKVCPVGLDRRMYKHKGIRKKYLAEAQALAENPADPDYRSWEHIRAYGAAKETAKKKN
jgi:formate hydrogenlyase subunit 6/NADH:ubiquinone oxidoreductase subunit I